MRFVFAIAFALTVLSATEVQAFHGRGRGCGILRLAARVATAPARAVRGQRTQARGHVDAKGNCVGGVCR